MRQTKASVGGPVQVKEKNLLSFLGGFFGFFLAIAALFLLFFDSPLPALSLSPGIPGVGLPGSAILAALSAVALLVFRWKCAWITRASDRLALRSLTFVGICLAPFGLLLEHLWVVSLPLIAIGVVLISYHWCLYLCKFTHMLLVSLISIAFALAAITAGVIAVLDFDDMTTVFIESCLALLSLLLLESPSTRETEELLVITPEESDKRSVTKRVDRWTYTIIGLDFGFAIGLVQALLTCDGESCRLLVSGTGSSAFVFVVPIALSSILLLIFRPRFTNVIEKYSKNYLAFSFAVGTLPLTILSTEGRILCVMLLLLVSCIQIIIVINASIEFIRFEELSPVWYMAEEASVAGGIAVGIALSRLTGIPNDHNGLLLSLGCFIVVLAGAFMQPVISKGAYPTQTSSSNRTQAVPLSAPLDEIDAAFDHEIIRDDHERHDRRPSKGDKGGIWRAKIDFVSRQYDLSPRQAEVLEFLAKGRDAKFIEDHFCISRSTAKSHIYNIYCKLDIHSRQELLDMVESVKLPDQSAAGTCHDLVSNETFARPRTELSG